MNSFRTRQYYQIETPQIRIERQLKEKLVSLKNELKELGIYVSLKDLVCGIIETVDLEEIKKDIIQSIKK